MIQIDYNESMGTVVIDPPYFHEFMCIYKPDSATLCVDVPTETRGDPFETWPEFGLKLTRERGHFCFLVFQYDEWMDYTPEPGTNVLWGCCPEKWKEEEA